MAFTNRQVEYPNRFVLYDDEGNELGRYTLVRDEGEIIEEGTPLTADNLNAEITSASQNAASTAVARINQAVTIDASNNVSYRNMQSGTAKVTVKAAKTTYKQYVKFPKAFTKRPNVIVTPWTGAPQVCFVSVSDITTTGFNIYFYRTTKVDTSILWIAHI